MSAEERRSARDCDAGVARLGFSAPSRHVAALGIGVGSEGGAHRPWLPLDTAVGSVDKKFVFHLGHVG